MSFGKRACGRAALAWALATIALAAPSSAQVMHQLTLAEALERARAMSPGLEIANARNEAARARERQAGAWNNPEVSYQVENFGGEGALRGMDNSESTIGVSQLLELGGKRAARRATASKQADVTAISGLIARADLEREVREQFAELSAAEERAQLAREAAERAERLAGLAQTLVDAGREPPLRLLRAQTAMAGARAQVGVAEAQLASARRALTALWGGSGEQIEAVGPWEFQQDAELSLTAPDETLDYRLAKAEHDATGAALRLERANAWIDVTVDAGVRQFRATDEQAFVAGVRIPIPIQNRNGGAIAAARADDRAARLQVSVAMTDAVRTLNDAQAEFLAADAQAKVLEDQAAPQAEEALNLARIGYEAGRFQLIDVLDAEDAFASIQNASIDARLARARAAAALARANAR